MATIISKIKRILFTYDWEVIEVQGAIFKALWGLWLLMPWQTFRAIAGYNSVGTENWWGWGLFGLGAFHLYAIFSGRLRFRRWTTFVAFLFWIFTVILIFQQSKTSALIPFFAIIAFFMGLNFVRMGKIGRTRADIDQRKIDIGPPEGTPERRILV